MLIVLKISFIDEHCMVVIYEMCQRFSDIPFRLMLDIFKSFPENYSLLKSNQLWSYLHFQQKLGHHQLQDARRRLGNTCAFQDLKVVTFPFIDKGLTEQIFEICTTLEISS